MNVTLKFERWAKSYSGCDGGNLKGSTWLCGIEWGMGTKHVLAEQIEKPVTRPPQVYKRPEDVLRGPDGSPFPLNKMFLKLRAVMLGRPARDWRSVLYEKPFPFHRRSDYFKLNLFPIAFKNGRAPWTDDHRKATGFSTKDEYYEWCRGNRFPRIRSWVRRGQPRLIICVGLGTKDEKVLEYQKAFGFEGVANKECIEGARLAWMSDGKSFLAVVPYPTYPDGLNSYERIEAFGKRLRAILNRPL